MTKPHLTVAERRLLAELDEEIRRRNRRGQSLVEAASDLWDGWKLREELDGLIRHRFLRVIQLPWECDIPKSEIDLRQCGTDWTVDLTDRAVQIFWPDRAAA